VYLNEYSGRDVRIAVIDSGVHPDHPHVGGVEHGVGIRSDGSVDADFIDRLGHGTAVTAAIREKSPDASVIAIKVFWDTLSTNVSALVRGMDEACARGATVINLSLGTPNVDHRPLLEAAIQRATSAGAILVTALEDRGTLWLPGSLTGVVPVVLDWECPREEYRLTAATSRRVVATSGYPRDIPGVPRERNLKGISFAVANATGFIARAMEAMMRTRAVAGVDGRLEEVLRTLESGLPVAAD
jgi:subtilisin family serine protease